VPVATYERINSLAQFLSSRFGAAALAPILPADARTPGALTDLAAHLGLSRVLATGDRTPFNGSLATDARMQLASAQIARRFVYPVGSTDTLIAARADSTGLIITLGQETVRAGFELVVDSMTTSVYGHPTLLPRHAAVPLLDGEHVRRGTLIVFSIIGERELGRIRITHLDGLLLLDPPTEGR
jgi:hypothetical protein